MARANLKAGLEYDKTDVFNLGSGSSITINQLAQDMQRITGIDNGIQYLPERKADVKHCKANAGKVWDKMGFKAVVSLEDGISEYLNWYQQNIVKK